MILREEWSEKMKASCSFPYEGCKCFERMGNDFWFLPADRCLYEEKSPSTRQVLINTLGPSARQVLIDALGLPEDQEQARADHVLERLAAAGHKIVRG
jgi:hypothetical protein